jgi:glutamate formiminotransferase
VPSFFYGAAARAPQRELLADVRAGEFEGLEARFEQLPPDVGEIPSHERAGAIAIGARNVLVAFNVELESGDLALAKAIARSLRERSGGLRGLRALGLRLSEGVVQVSLNVTDVEATPLYRIVESIARLAAKNGVAIRRSELIGLIPRAAVETSARYYLGTL